ncbi:hypothetical protein MCOR25_006887 [Pyricularia grisea]|nr:hypothetical protein MCOR25_006887 [Pyricularia grisea]
MSATYVTASVGGTSDPDAQQQQHEQKPQPPKSDDNAVQSLEAPEPVGSLSTTSVSNQPPFESDHGLSFADLPPDLAELRFSEYPNQHPGHLPTIYPRQQQQQQEQPDNKHNDVNVNDNPDKPTHSHESLNATAFLQNNINAPVIVHQPPGTSQPPLACIDADSLDDSSSQTSQQPTSVSPARITARRPSPGLAARLKALGFGSSNPQRETQSAAALRAEAIGRLDEEQLRQLDQGHQAGSEAPIVERRGRPWKGALVRIPSKASLKGLKFRSGKKSPNSVSHSDAEVAASPAAVVAPEVPEGPELLPEIHTVPELAMDTNKFRLPDHSNGNGTKCQPETRQQHLDRDSIIMSPTTPDDDERPPPPPKDSPPLSSATTPATDFSQEIHFNPLGLQRPGSIYTLSRASFSNQLAQLTSLQLPDANSLSEKVAAISTAQSATRALIGAAEQIRNWISKASEVISGLDSDDDVEWSAAGGREGLEEVESAISRFESLIKVYLSAIEALNNRPDVGSVAPEDLARTVMQMEAITKEWANIHVTLNSVKGQVEIAMEWEELWNMVLGDIQNEMDELCRLVFEMEERRHRSMLAVSNGQDNVDIGDLETIVEETPPAATRLQAAKSHRFSLPAFPASPSSPGVPSLTQDDSSLLALFARMQPLRASLDFLPMRLSAFAARAEKTFPSAAEELEMRREDLDNSYKKLEKDAENLRKELGEDRWILVFRGAARQAQKMYESVERSVSKIKECVDAGLNLTNPALMGKKIESYEAKKTHYSPAIERVLSIIDRGIKDRLTVNGEIVRLHTELQTKWDELRDRMRDMDLTLDELTMDDKGQALRDSISTMLSNDMSGLGSGHETPQSSPPSSVIMSNLGLETPTSKILNKRRSASGNASALPMPTNRRSLSAVVPSQQQPRKPISRLSTTGGLGRDSSLTPMAKPRPSTTRPSNNPIPNRPRWNSSVNGVDTGHNFKPLAVEPQSTPSPRSSASKMPLRSPLSGRAGSASPMPDVTPSKPPSSHSRYSFRERLTSPGPYSQQAVAASRMNQPRLTAQSSSSSSALSNRRSSLQPPGRPKVDAPLGTSPVRPASSMATTNPRRTSALPQSTGSMGLFRDGVARSTSVSGRNTPSTQRAPFRKSQTEKPMDSKPRWKF